jgi:hypothetical protein
MVLATDAACGRLRLTHAQMLSLLIPFAVIFTPQSYLVHSVIGFGGQVKALALMAVVAAAVSAPLASSIFNELPEHPVMVFELEVAEREYA